VGFTSSAQDPSPMDVDEAVNGLAQVYLPTPLASPSSPPGSPGPLVPGPPPRDPSSLGESILLAPEPGRPFPWCSTSVQLGAPFGMPSNQPLLAASPGPPVTALGPPPRMVPPLTLPPGSPAGPDSAALSGPLVTALGPPRMVPPLTLQSGSPAGPYSAALSGHPVTALGTLLSAPISARQEGPLSEQCSASHSGHPAQAFHTPTNVLLSALHSGPPAETMPVPLQPLPLDTLELLQDRLGKFVLHAAAGLGSVSFDDLCVCHRGPSCLTGGAMAPHPAIPLLLHLRDYGAAVNRSAPDWTLDQRDAAILRGAHHSTRVNRDFVRDEFADMVEAGQWLVLPYALIRHLPGLCLSPTGLVPQRDRRDRLIVDYTHSGVNQTTILSAPDSMQYGFALLRLLQALQRADTRRGPI
jgi:hypothetical protein